MTLTVKDTLALCIRLIGFHNAFSIVSKAMAIDRMALLGMKWELIQEGWHMPSF